jgi:uncharacterized protein
MRLRILFPVFAFLIITACTTVSTSPTRTGTASNNVEAQQLLNAGKFREAALNYENEASLMKANRRDVPMLRAADAWEKAGELNKARDALSKSTRKDLNGSDAFLHDVLSAQFLIADKRGNEAVRLLNQSPSAVPENELKRWHNLRLLAFEAAGMQFDVAGEQAWLMQGLSAKARTAAARNIERLMSLVPAPELAQKSAQLTSSDALYSYAVRELKKRGMPLPAANSNTGSAASSGVAARTDAFPPAESDGYRPPAQIALLLPLSGSTAGAGFAVRDGFMSKYYSDDRRRPRVSFYDTAGSADGARRAAQRAISDGAQMLVGPLTREEVNAVSAMNDINVPVLLLNRGANGVSNGNISFALSPDEEGWISADRLANRKLTNILVFTQRDDTAQRTLSAFKDQFRSRGGNIISETLVEGDDATATAKIAAVLAASANTPADAVYFTLKAPQARQVMKAMAGNTTTHKMVLSSSYILNGANAAQDVVFNGVQMPELPWLLNQTYGLPSSDTIAKNPNLRGPAQRLYAFGADAWQLSAYYERLQRDAAFSIQGATGNLRIDSLGNVQRDPAWAIFSSGRPRVAAE